MQWQESNLRSHACKTWAVASWPISTDSHFISLISGGKRDSTAIFRRLWGPLQEKKLSSSPFISTYLFTSSSNYWGKATTSVLFWDFSINSNNILTIYGPLHLLIYFIFKKVFKQNPKITECHASYQDVQNEKIILESIGLEKKLFGKTHTYS